MNRRRGHSTAWGLGWLVLVYLLCMLPQIVSATPVFTQRRPARRVVSRAPRRVVAQPAPRNAVRQPTGAQRAYPDVKAMTVDMLQRCSPKDYYYVGLGHSPSKLVAFLQAISPELARTFPASGLGGSDQTKTIDTQWAAYRKHLDALLPEAVVNGQRKILLIDYSYGPSLDNFRYALKRYLKEKGSAIKVETASFRPDAKTLQGRLKTAQADHKLRTGNASVIYDGGQGQEIAEFKYHKHTIGRHTLESLRTDARWAKRVQSYKQLLAADATMKPLLAEIGQWLGALDAPAGQAALPTAKPTPQATPVAPQARAVAPVQKKKQPAPRQPKTPSRPPQRQQASVQPKVAPKGQWSRKPKASPPGWNAGDPANKGQMNATDRQGKLHSVLSTAEQRETNDLLVELDATLPAANYHYLGAGRTSTPLVTFVQSLNPGLASYLPTDGLSKSLDAQGAIKAEYHKAYFALFDRFLPQAVKDGRKSVALLKKTDSGDSLRPLADLLKSYLDQQNGRAWPGRMATVGYGVKPEKAKNLTLHLDLTKKLALRHFFDGHAYRAVAPYERHQVGSTPKVQARPTHHGAYEKKLDELLRQNAVAATLRKAFVQL